MKQNDSFNEFVQNFSGWNFAASNFLYITIRIIFIQYENLQTRRIRYKDNADRDKN